MLLRVHSVLFQVSSESSASSLAQAQDFRWLGKREWALETAAPAHSSLVRQPLPPMVRLSQLSAFPQTQEGAFSEPMTVPQAEDPVDTVFKGLSLASGAS